MDVFEFFWKTPKTMLDVLMESPAFMEQKQRFDAANALRSEGMHATTLPKPFGSFGHEITNPIPCETVFGSISYLGRLRAADGSKVAYRQTGSFESPVSHYHVDEYEIAQATGRKLATIYIDPYGLQTSSMPIKGFVLSENALAVANPETFRIVAGPGVIEYLTCNIRHRQNGPAVVENYASGGQKYRRWYRFGVLDRDDGPAIVGDRVTNGHYEWWREGRRHRTGGPAVIQLFGTMEYGDGPVGDFEWWINGVKQKAQDRYGILYYFKNDECVLIELPDGSRKIERDGRHRDEDINGNEVEIPYLESYDGYLTYSESMNELHRETDETIDAYEA